MAVLAAIMLSNMIVMAESSGNFNITFALIKDVLEYQAKVAAPGITTALLCDEGMVSQDEAVHLIKHMSASVIMISSPLSWQNFLVQMNSDVNVKNTYTYVLDLSCTGSTLLLQEANRKMMFTSRNRWLFLLKNQTFPKTSGLEMLLDSDVTIASRISMDQFLLEEVYRHGEELIRKKIGTWKIGRGATLTAPLIVCLRRMNLQKSIIKAVMAVTRNETLNNLYDTSDKRDTITKVNNAIFDHVVRIINASVDMIITNTWGYSIINGTWNGLTGYLQREKADIGVTPMYITEERLRHLLYIPSASATRSAFILRQPPLTIVENIFTLPFSRSAWLAATGLLTLIGILLHVIFCWEWNKHLRTKEITWSDVVLLCLGALCQQGSSIVARSNGGRIIIILLFGTTIFMYTYYSASIVALLQSPSNSVQTLEDLLRGSIALGVFDAIYYRHFFSTANDSVRHAIYTRKVSPPGGPEQFMSMEEGMERVRMGMFAFHAELGLAYKIVSDTFLEEEKCGLQVINFLFDMGDTYVPISKHTPYKEILTIAYQRVYETGLHHCEHTRYYEKKPKCSSNGLNFVSAGLLDCSAAFLLLGYGFLCAMLMLITEVLIHKSNHTMGRGERLCPLKWNYRVRCLQQTKPETELFIRRKKDILLKEEEGVRKD